MSYQKNGDTNNRPPLGRSPDSSSVNDENDNEAEPEHDSATVLVETTILESHGSNFSHLSTSSHQSKATNSSSSNNNNNILPEDKEEGLLQHGSSSSTCSVTSTSSSTNGRMDPVAMEDEHDQKHDKANESHRQDNSATTSRSTPTTRSTSTKLGRSMIMSSEKKNPNKKDQNPHDHIHDIILFDDDDDDYLDENEHQEDGFHQSHNHHHDPPPPPTPLLRSSTSRLFYQMPPPPLAFETSSAIPSLPGAFRMSFRRHGSSSCSGTHNNNNNNNNRNEIVDNDDVSLPNNYAIASAAAAAAATPPNFSADAVSSTWTTSTTSSAMLCHGLSTDVVDADENDEERSDEDDDDDNTNNCNNDSNEHDTTHHQDDDQAVIRSIPVPPPPPQLFQPGISTISLLDTSSSQYMVVVAAINDAVVVTEDDPYRYHSNGDNDVQQHHHQIADGTAIQADDSDDQSHQSVFILGELQPWYLKHKVFWSLLCGACTIATLSVLALTGILLLTNANSSGGTNQINNANTTTSSGVHPQPSPLSQHPSPTLSPSSPDRIHHHNHSYEVVWEQIGSSVEGSHAGGKFGYSVSAATLFLDYSLSSSQNLPPWWNGTTDEDTSHNDVHNWWWAAGVPFWSREVMGSIGIFYPPRPLFDSTITNNSDAALLQQQHQQVGIGLVDGESPPNAFGWSISMVAPSNGTLILAGGAPHSENAHGMVRVSQYELGMSIVTSSLGVWFQMGEDLIGQDQGHFFGNVVSLSADGRILAVGSADYALPRRLIQRVQVFWYDGQNNNWTNYGQDLFGTTPADNFGISLALSADGSILAIGSNGVFVYNDTTMSNINATITNTTNSSAIPYGQVTVFQFHPKPGNPNEGRWEMLGEPMMGSDENPYFGTSIALSHDGTILAAGGYGNSQNGVNCGYVKAFQYTSKANTTAASNNSSDTNDNNNIDIPDINGTYTQTSMNNNTLYFHWQQMGHDIYGSAANDFFGSSVSLSADGMVLAVSANQHNTTEQRGYVRIYRYYRNHRRRYHQNNNSNNQTNTTSIGGDWHQQGSDLIGEVPGEQFGYSLSLSANGQNIVVGAPYPLSESENGLVRIYQAQRRPLNDTQKKTYSPASSSPMWSITTTPTTST